MTALQIILLIIAFLFIIFAIGFIIWTLIKAEIDKFIRRLDDHENYTGFDNFKS